MTAFRSPRLESLLRSRWDQASYTQVADLVGAQAPEAPDLDFKVGHYQLPPGAPKDAQERKRFELAKDVAAMANSAGGLLIVGIGEDDQARAARVANVPITDGHKRWVDDVVSSWIYPRPVAEARSVENPDDPGRGFLLIAVPWSPSGPHAVAGPGGALTYPRRSGTTTTYLSEMEVSQAYRNRFMGFGRQKGELETVHEELVKLLTHESAYDGVRVIVSLVPDIPGYFRVDADSFNSFRSEVVGDLPLVGGSRKGTWVSHYLRRGRFIAHGGYSSVREPACILHSTGAGTIAIPVESREVPADASYQVSDEDVVDAILGSLRFLARHARDRAATGGVAAMQAQIETTGGDLRLASIGMFADQLGNAILDYPPVADGVASIDDLAVDGPSLVTATHTLVAALFQEFGLAEPSQITRDGEIRRGGWAPIRWRNHYIAWAEDSDITVID